jgi:hypothetical protein
MYCGFGSPPVFATNLEAGGILLPLEQNQRLIAVDRNVVTQYAGEHLKSTVLIEFPMYDFSLFGVTAKYDGSIEVVCEEKGFGGGRSKYSLLSLGGEEYTLVTQFPQIDGNIHYASTSHDGDFLGICERSRDGECEVIIKDISSQEDEEVIIYRAPIYTGEEILPLNQTLPNRPRPTRFPQCFSWDRYSATLYYSSPCGELIRFKCDTKRKDILGRGVLPRSFEGWDHLLVRDPDSEEYFLYDVEQKKKQHIPLPEKHLDDPLINLILLPNGTHGLYFAPSWRESRYVLRTIVIQSGIWERQGSWGGYFGDDIDVGSYHAD